MDTGPLTEQTKRPGEDGDAADPLTHAWNWFKYHAEQRMIVVRFYLIVVGALGAGYLTALERAENLIAAIIAGFGCLVSELFARLDRRTRHLIKASEAALSKQQGEMARATGIDEMRIVDRPEPGTGWTYSDVFAWLFHSATLTLAVAAAIALQRAAGTHLLDLWTCLAGH